MIAKLEWKQSNAEQNKDKHRAPTNNGNYTKQHDHRIERTAAQATVGGWGVGGA